MIACLEKNLYLCIIIRKNSSIYKIMLVHTNRHSFRVQSLNKQLKLQSIL